MENLSDNLSRYARYIIDSQYRDGDEETWLLSISSKFLGCCKPTILEEMRDLPCETHYMGDLAS